MTNPGAGAADHRSVPQIKNGPGPIRSDFWTPQRETPRGTSPEASSVMCGPLRKTDTPALQTWNVRTARESATRGLDRPCNCMNLSASDRAGAVAPSPSCRRSHDLPEPNHEAHLRLGERTHRGELRGLPVRAEAVLYEYLAKADLSGVEGRGRCRVFDTAVRELQDATDYCRRSISGANADLVAWSLIERPPQKIRGARRPGTPIGKTWLTPYADALFFSPRAQNVARPVDKEPNLSGVEGAALQAAEKAAHP